VHLYICSVFSSVLSLFFILPPNPCLFLVFPRFLLMHPSPRLPHTHLQSVAVSLLECTRYTKYAFARTSDPEIEASSGDPDDLVPFSRWDPVDHLNPRRRDLYGHRCDEKRRSCSNGPHVCVTCISKQQAPCRIRTSHLLFVRAESIRAGMPNTRSTIPTAVSGLGTLAVCIRSSRLSDPRSASQSAATRRATGTALQFASTPHLHLFPGHR
jgi:hypothetical protein